MKPDNGNLANFGENDCQTQQNPKIRPLFSAGTIEIAELRSLEPQTRSLFCVPMSGLTYETASRSAAQAAGTSKHPPMRQTANLNMMASIVTVQRHPQSARDFGTTGFPLFNGLSARTFARCCRLVRAAALSFPMSRARIPSSAPE